MRFWNEAKDGLYLIQLVWPWREGGVRTENLLMSSWVLFTFTFCFEPQVAGVIFCFFHFHFSVLSTSTCQAIFFLIDECLHVLFPLLMYNWMILYQSLFCLSFHVFTRNLFWTMKFILFGFSVINLKQLKVAVSKEVNTQMNSNSNSSQFVATISVVIFQNSDILSRAHSRPISPWSRRRSQKSSSLFTFSFLCFAFPC